VWPNVDTRESAEWATKQAFWAAVLLAAITCAFGLLSAFGVGLVKALGFDGALVHGAIFAAIAFGLGRHSRLAAWSGLVFYIADRIYAWATVGMKNPPVIAAIFILAFVGGVRGTSALHGLKRIEPGQSKSDVI
jgi:hypothetical protein